MMTSRHQPDALWDTQHCGFPLRLSIMGTVPHLHPDRMPEERYDPSYPRRHPRPSVSNGKRDKQEKNKKYTVLSVPNSIAATCIASAILIRYNYIWISTAHVLLSATLPTWAGHVNVMLPPCGCSCPVHGTSPTEREMQFSRSVNSVNCRLCVPGSSATRCPLHEKEMGTRQQARRLCDI